MAKDLSCFTIVLYTHPVSGRASFEAGRLIDGCGIAVRLPSTPSNKKRWGGKPAVLNRDEPDPICAYGHRNEYPHESVCLNALRELRRAGQA